MNRGIVTRIVPGSVLNEVRKARRYLARRYVSTLPPHRAFDAIYSFGLWGGRDQPSGPGSYGPWADGFADLVNRLIETEDIRSVADIGCGDFNVGSKIAAGVDRYEALDISKEIIRRNIQKHAHHANVSFRQFDLLTDALPEVDLIFVRQVLQHLSNDQIESALRNLETSRAKVILVAEDVVLSGLPLKPNLDLKTHSLGTRVEMGSGVFLEGAPFLRKVEVISELPDPYLPGSTNALRTVRIIGCGMATEGIRS